MEKKSSTSSLIEIKPEKTLVVKVAGLDGLFSSFIMKAIFLLIWLGGIASVAVVTSFYIGLAEWTTAQLGFSFILISIMLAYWAIRSFYIYRLKNIETGVLGDAKDKITKGQACNLFGFFSLELAKATKNILLQDLNNISTKDLGSACRNALKCDSSIKLIA